MRGVIRALGLSALMGLILTLPVFGNPTWNGIVDQMADLLVKAPGLVSQGDRPGARDLVNQAYFSFYEKEGMERAVLSHISGKRASLVEYQFAAAKKVILTPNSTPDEVKKEVTLLVTQLREDANRLDGRKTGALTTFAASFVILTREGAEAILILGAILAFLVKSGNRRKNGVIYLSAGAAVLASLLSAFLLQSLFQISGASQEVLEGLTMLTAVAVLFFVSHWMVSKAESDRWQTYIDGKVQASVTRGSSWALGLTCFLAVYREGAETVLFYQALFLEGGRHTPMIWLGMAAAVVVLGLLFLAVRYGSVRIPFKPFFWGTGSLMYLMAIVFAGGGVKELQEGDWVSATPLAGVPSVDLLGIYPTWETLVPQIVLVVLALATLPWYLRKKPVAS